MIESIRAEGAVELISGRPDTGVVLTCEHASNHLPAPWAWPEQDLWLVDSHWAIDLGIAEVTRALAAALGAPAVLARFSRLLCDVNRPLDADTLFRTTAEGRPIALNVNADPADRARRISRFHVPYHAVVDSVLGGHARASILSMHSFTPVYEAGPARPMQIGLLFDREEEVSRAMAESLSADGWKVALNEPYSGRDGLIYSADRHATRHGRRALELEVRQDVASDAEIRPRLVASLARALEHAGVA
jgi:predicted N-formylglutamate amidohydrolase